MTEIIYLLTILYASYAIDEVVGDTPFFLIMSFSILGYLIVT